MGPGVFIRLYVGSLPRHKAAVIILQGTVYKTGSELGRLFSMGHCRHLHSRPSMMAVT